jgi:hypothetical protein
MSFALTAGGALWDLETESRLVREIADLERRIEEARDLRSLYHDHLLRLLSYRLGQRRQALECLRTGHDPRTLAGLDLRPLR